MAERKHIKPTKRHAPKRRPRPTKEQARAWLASVLVPLSTELDTAAECLGHGSWSFRASSQDLEYLQPTAWMLAPRFRPNLEQLFRFHPKFRALSEEHDEAWARLLRACQVAYGRLLEAEPFQQLASGWQEPSERRFLPEYVINGLKELGWGYSLREFWAR